MLFRKKTAVASVAAVEPVPVPTPQALQALDHDVAAQYVDTCQAIGLNSAADQVILLGVLERKGLAPYSADHVTAYLNAQYGATPWGWRALREQDNPSDYGRQRRALGHWVDQFGCIDGDYTRHWGLSENGDLIGGFDSDLYAKPIPLPVLMTIREIIEAVPRATIWISDELHPVNRPPSDSTLDPFVMVRLAGDQRCIVERWDEPGFTRSC